SCAERVQEERWRDDEKLCVHEFWFVECSCSCSAPNNADLTEKKCQPERLVAGYPDFERRVFIVGISKEALDSGHSIAGSQSSVGRPHAPTTWSLPNQIEPRLRLGAAESIDPCVRVGTTRSWQLRLFGWYPVVVPIELPEIIQWNLF